MRNVAETDAIYGLCLAETGRDYSITRENNASLCKILLFWRLKVLTMGHLVWYTGIVQTWNSGICTATPKNRKRHPHATGSAGRNRNYQQIKLYIKRNIQTLKRRDIMAQQGFIKESMEAMKNKYPVFRGMQDNHVFIILSIR